jgi:hypothetical protein
MAQLRISKDRELSTRTYTRLLRVLGTMAEYEGRTVKPVEAGKVADLLDEMGVLLAPYAVDPGTGDYYQDRSAAVEAVMEASPTEMLAGVSQIIEAEKGAAVPPATSGS